MRQHGRHAAERHVYLSADQIDDRRAAAFIRNMHDVHARQPLQKFRAKMVWRAHTARPRAQVTRFCLRERNQFAHVFRRQLRIGHQQLRHDHDHAHRREIPDRVVGQFVRQQRIDHHARRRAEHNRIAVRRRLRGDHGAQHAAGAAAVIDHHLVSERCAQFLRQRAADEVGVAAWRIGDDHADRFDRIGLGRNAGCAQCCRRHEQMQ